MKEKWNLICGCAINMRACSKVCLRVSNSSNVSSFDPRAP